MKQFSENKSGLMNLSRSKSTITLLALLILVSVLAVFYRDVVFGGRTFLSLQTTAGTMPYLTSGGGAYEYPGDINTFSGAPMDVGTVAWLKEPDLFYSRKEFQKGHLPLWSPYQGLGQPHNASGLSGVWDPINILTYLSSDNFWPYAVDLEMLLRHLIAGFFTYLFLIELGLSFEAACFGGIAFMLSAFFATFGGHQLIRVQALLPLLLYTFERMFKNPSARTALPVILSTLWCLIADFPEASFLILMLASLWYIARLFSSRHESLNNKSLFKQRILCLASAAGISIMLSGPWLLPFVENMQNHSAHEEGSRIGMFAIPRNYLFDLFLIKRLPLNNLAGMFTPTLAGLGLICVFALRHLRKQRCAIIFFSVFFAVWFSKLFNFTITAWLGKLPFIEQILLTRDMEPLLSFCLVVLAAHGVQICLENAVPGRRLLYAFLTTLLLFCFFASTSNWQAIKSSDILIKHYTKSISLLLFELTIPFIIIASISAFKFNKALLLIALSTVVFFSGSLRELKLRCLRHNPYKEPPFVKYIKEQDHTDTDRIFAYDMMLYPNIAQAYDINDIRYISALDSDRRKEFVDNFLARRHETLRLTGNEPQIYLGRFFDLCSVDYILTPFVPDFHSSLDPVDHFWKNSRAIEPIHQNRLDLLEYIAITKQSVPFPFLSTGKYTIAGDQRDSIFLHPEGTVSCNVTIPDSEAVLRFAVGLDPKCFDMIGDGTIFKVTLRDGTGTEKLLFEKYIDPKKHNEHRRWFDESVTLSPWAGQKVQLNFSTEGGPSDDASADWALWARPYIEGNGIAGINPVKFRIMNSEMVHTFRNTSAFPKAFVVFNAIHTANIKDAVTVMKNPDFDPSRTAVIDGEIPESLNPILINQTSITDAPDPVAATVTERAPNRLKVQVSTDKPGLLVVSEGYWQGWRAFVDGKKTSIIPAYLMMRSVPVDKGHHVIEFVYFPTSFKLGIGLMSAGIILLACWNWHSCSFRAGKS